MEVRGEYLSAGGRGEFYVVVGFFSWEERILEAIFIRVVCGVLGGLFVFGI